VHFACKRNAQKERETCTEKHTSTHEIIKSEMNRKQENQLNNNMYLMGMYI